MNKNNVINPSNLTNHNPNLSISLEITNFAPVIPTVTIKQPKK